MTNIKRISTTCLQCNRALYVEDGPICLVCAPAKDPTDARTSYKDVRIKITDIQPDGTPRAEMYVWSLDPLVGKQSTKETDRTKGDYQRPDTQCCGRFG